MVLPNYPVDEQEGSLHTTPSAPPTATNHVNNNNGTNMLPSSEQGQSVPHEPHATSNNHEHRIPTATAVVVDSPHHPSEQHYAAVDGTLLTEVEMEEHHVPYAVGIVVRGAPIGDSDPLTITAIAVQAAADQDVMYVLAKRMRLSCVLFAFSDMILTGTLGGFVKFWAFVLLVFPLAGGLGAYTFRIPLIMSYLLSVPVAFAVRVYLLYDALSETPSPDRPPREIPLLVIIGGAAVQMMSLYGFLSLRKVVLSCSATVIVRLRKEGITSKNGCL